MNKKMKKRMTIVGGVVVIAVILLLAFLGGSNASEVLKVQDALTGDYKDKKVQVTGVVVDNSYMVDDKGALVFEVADEGDVAQAKTLRVSYDKGVSATFGNGVTAICTGRIADDGTLVATELVTKCPSKYENASDALTVASLLGYDKSTMVGKTVKVSGTVSELSDATSAIRFVVVDESDAAQTLGIVFHGALSDGVTEGASVVVTGSLEQDGTFLASAVSLKN